jgi:hypothetical protein
LKWQEQICFYARRKLAGNLVGFQELATQQKSKSALSAGCPKRCKLPGKTPLPRPPALAAGLSPTSFCASGTILNCFYEFMT